MPSLEHFSRYCGDLAIHWPGIYIVDRGGGFFGAFSLGGLLRWGGRGGFSRIRGESQSAADNEQRQPTNKSVNHYFNFPDNSTFWTKCSKNCSQFANRSLMWWTRAAAPHRGAIRTAPR